jgi:hypothetical protein
MPITLVSSLPFPDNPVVSALSALYRTGENINEFLDRHTDDLKRNASATVLTTGNVLDGARQNLALGK